METGVAVTGQEIGPGFHTPVNPDGYVTIDVESFSHVIHKDIPSSSPRVTVALSFYCSWLIYIYIYMYINLALLISLSK